MICNVHCVFTHNVMISNNTYIIIIELYESNTIHSQQYVSKYPTSQNNSRSTTIQLPEWNNVHIDMQESQQNDSKQLDWYAPWP